MEERQFTWRTHRIAIDFDGVLCTDEYPEIGAPNWLVIREAATLRKSGACLILWTCREGQRLQEAVDACKGWGLEFDAVNENPPFFRDLWQNDCRKVGADEYWDDRSVYVGPGKEFRHLHGSSVELRSHKWIRQFLTDALRPNLAIWRESRDNGVRSASILLGQAEEIIEQLLDETTEPDSSHTWYRDGYSVATENAAKWISGMVQAAQAKEESEATQDGGE